MKIIDLSGRWSLKRLKTGDEYSCNIPGDNISALVEAGVISDPYYGENESGIQWIAGEDWSVSTAFDADASLAATDNVIILLEYVDTIFELYINGEKAGGGENFFSGYRFNIARLIRKGKNELEFVFRSAENAASDMLKKLPYPVPHSQYPVQSQGRNLIRKVQCHSGWDWGPCLMVSGVYSPPVIKASDGEIIERAYCCIKPSDKNLKQWELDIEVELRSVRAEKIQLTASCAGTSSTSEIETRAGIQTESIKLIISKPELWWPSGYGGQALYSLKIESTNDSYEKEIGFRSLKVKTETDADGGIGMIFVVNNREIFARGANWIPSDALPSRQTRERYEDLLNSAADANMNMLRVWGGGQYENDYFYALCDRKGILVWQDFMFACSMYPADPEFLENVRGEVDYQIKRLKDHPSLALWCGNNENVGALSWFDDSRENRDRYIVDYDRLNEGVIGKRVKELDPDHQWWPSSPSAGEGDYSDCWHNDSKGDMHYWSVWHEGKPFEAYYDVIPRFCSEFGFQSFPSMKAIRGFCPPDQRNITSPVMEHHQRNDNGNTIILQTLSRYYRMPVGLKETVYLSRIQQAEAIRTAVEYWRTKRPVCMGALYWQLNDVWPTASWSSLDYDGGWKPLHYSAKRFFAPLMLTAHETSSTEIAVTLCNEGIEAVSGELFIELYDFTGNIIKKEQLPVEAAAGTAICCKTLSAQKADSFRREHFYYLRFVPANAETEIAENRLLLEKPKRCSIQPSKISIDLEKHGNDFQLVLRSDTPAFNAFIEHESWSGRFSDNNITILPGREVKIGFIGPEIGKPEIFIKGLSVHSLRNV